MTTEGTQIEQGRLFTRLMITANGKASDGMDLSTLETFEADDPSKLPKDARDSGGGAEIRRAVAGSAEGAAGRSVCGTGDSYPAARRASSSTRFSGIAWKGHRQKDENEGQTFTKSVNMPVLPDFLSVIFDPTIKRVSKASRSTALMNSTTRA